MSQKLSVQLLGAEEGDDEEEQEDAEAEDAEDESAEVSDEDRPDFETASEEKEVDDGDDEEEEEEEDDLEIEAGPEQGALGEHMQILGKCGKLPNLV